MISDLFGERKDGPMTEPQPPPLQADSPTVLFDGRVVERYRPPGVGGGDFAVDLANAPQAIRELRGGRSGAPFDQG